MLTLSNKPIQCTQFNNNNQHSFKTPSLCTPLLKSLPNEAQQNTTRTSFGLVGKSISLKYLKCFQGNSYIYHSLRSSCQDLSEVWRPKISHHLLTTSYGTNPICKYGYQKHILSSMTTSLLLSDKIKSFAHEVLRHLHMSGSIILQMALYYLEAICVEILILNPGCSELTTSI